MILKIKPKDDCKSCHGLGEVFDIVPYGATVAYLPSFCYCVEEQIPDDDDNDDDIEIELLYTTIQCQYLDIDYHCTLEKTIACDHCDMTKENQNDSKS